ncbi:hypothetical protein GGX14DRAFT_676020 [Mycena pura]|uniref:Uncharacterized protein n=1 Tax=Mycena pura TaxID=153505 RepID=A0AAD6VRW4_9AGAR|nr:hypothetical protein GGX14DRAFT_676020 [Mycena pura]
MPRKAAAAADGETETSAEPRRSSRIKEMPAVPTPPKKVSKPRAKKEAKEGDDEKPKRGRKRKESAAGEENAADAAGEGEGEGDGEAPAAKKAKPATPTSKPPSKAASKPSSKPASKASAKPASKASVKPASRAGSKKPASKVRARRPPYPISPSSPFAEHDATAPAVDETIAEDPEAEAAAETLYASASHLAVTLLSLIPYLSVSTIPLNYVCCMPVAIHNGTRSNVQRYSFPVICVLVEPHAALNIIQLEGNEPGATQAADVFVMPLTVDYRANFVI